MKKKIFSLLTLLATVCSGAWAGVTTITYDFKTAAASGGITESSLTSSGVSAGTNNSTTIYYPTQLSSELGNRFAFQYREKNNNTNAWAVDKSRNGLWVNCASGGDEYMSILNLYAGDVITITIATGKLKFSNTVNCTYDNSGTATTPDAWSYVESDKDYTIVANGKLDLQAMKYGNGGNAHMAISKIVIKTTASETMGAPTIAATGANGGQRTITITPGVGSASSAATATYYTTDGSDPSNTNGTAYTDPFTIEATTTIKAVSYLGETIGEIATQAIEAGTTLQLNAPTVSISSIAENAGVYNPVYSWTSDQSSVIGAPEVTYTYTFAGGSSTAGTSYTPTATGTLTVTASADGYTSNSTVVEVTDFSYVKSYTADFSTLTKNENSGYDNTTFNGAGCSFWTFDNTFSEKVTLSGFHLAWAISTGKVAGIFARTGSGTITYTGYFPTNSVIYLACASRTAGYAKYSTSNTVNIAQYNGVYNMTVYVPSSSVATVTIGSTGWATFSDATNILDFANAYPAGLTAYQITGYSGTTVTKSAIDAPVAASTGLLLNGTASTTYYVPIEASASADVSGNLLVAGTGAEINAESGKTKYVLGVNGSEAEFQKIVSYAATVPVGKAYLQFNEEINARSLSFFDESTGINTVKKAEAANGKYFNLAGQRIAKPTKGLYIVNGKKIVVK